MGCHCEDILLVGAILLGVGLWLAFEESPVLAGEKVSAAMNTVPFQNAVKGATVNVENLSGPGGVLPCGLEDFEDVFLPSRPESCRDCWQSLTQHRPGSAGFHRESLLV